MMEERTLNLYGAERRLIRAFVNFAELRHSSWATCSLTPHRLIQVNEFPLNAEFTDSLLYRTSQTRTSREDLKKHWAQFMPS
jgi:hypothetical protein